MSRVVFLVDGFNLYHSIRDLCKDTTVNTKWLDIRSLCQSYLHLFGKDALLTDIYYFSAIRFYMQSSDPGIISRHKLYIRCLEDTGIITILGRFKEKSVFCHKCSSKLKKHEEKETDVSIAIKILQLAFFDLADIIVIITGDTDLAPAVKAAFEYSKKVQICFGFPYRRKNAELERLTKTRCFVINQTQYLNHQFSDPYKLSTGAFISKPLEWA